MNRQNFLVGVGKNMCIEPRPLGGCGAMLPQEILHALRLLLGHQNGWKLATNEYQKKINCKILGGGGGGGGEGGNPSAPPPSV